MYYITHRYKQRLELHMYKKTNEKEKKENRLIRNYIV